MSTSRQVVLWVPPGPNGEMPRGGFQLPLAGEAPERVWTLYRHRAEGEAPALPFKPIHRHNAFLEDVTHDWTHRNGELRYYSRVSDGGHWILLEYKST